MNERDGRRLRREGEGQGRSYQRHRPVNQPPLLNQPFDPTGTYGGENIMQQHFQQTTLPSSTYHTFDPPNQVQNIMQQHFQQTTLPSSTYRSFDFPHEATNQMQRSGQPQPNYLLYGSNPFQSPYQPNGNVPYFPYSPNPYSSFEESYINQPLPTQAYGAPYQAPMLQSRSIFQQEMMYPPTFNPGANIPIPPVPHSHQPVVMRRPLSDPVGAPDLGQHTHIPQHHQSTVLQDSIQMPQERLITSSSTPRAPPVSRHLSPQNQSSRPAVLQRRPASQQPRALPPSSNVRLPPNLVQQRNRTGLTNPTNRLMAYQPGTRKFRRLTSPSAMQQETPLLEGQSSEKAFIPPPTRQETGNPPSTPEKKRKAVGDEEEIDGAEAEEAERAKQREKKRRRAERNLVPLEKHRKLRRLLPKPE